MRQQMSEQVEDSGGDDTLVRTQNQLLQTTYASVHLQTWWCSSSGACGGGGHGAVVLAVLGFDTSSDLSADSTNGQPAAMAADAL